MEDDNYVIVEDLGGAAGGATVPAVPESATAPESGTTVPDPALANPAVAEAARAFAAQSSPEEVRELAELIQQFGIPAARTLFEGMVEHSKLNGQQRRAAYTAIRNFSKIDQPGCFTVDFPDGGERAYILLDRCGIKHDFARQLGRIRGRITDDAQWSTITRQMSMLVFYGRNVYGQLAEKNAALIREMFPGEDVAPYMATRVDMENTTLYLRPDWPVRIGIFVRLQSDLDRELEALEKKKAKAAGGTPAGQGTSAGATSAGATHPSALRKQKQREALARQIEQRRAKLESQQCKDQQCEAQQCEAQRCEAQQD